MSLYDTLGVDKSADAATIRRAYRKKAQKSHPDKGGKKEEFHALQLAYDVLSDDARRASYDANGETGNQNDPRSSAISQLAALMFSFIDQADVETTDIHAHLVRAVTDGKKKLNQMKKDSLRDIAKREKALKRIKYKGPGANILAEMLQGDIDVRKRSIVAMDEEFKKADLMLEILADYDYQIDIFPQNRNAHADAFSTLFKFST